MLVVELVVPLQDELARPEDLRGRLGGRLTYGLGLAELAGEVAGAGARGSGAQGGVAEREAGSGGLQALSEFLHLLFRGEHLV